MCSNRFQWQFFFKKNSNFDFQIRKQDISSKNQIDKKKQKKIKFIPMNRMNNEKCLNSCSNQTSQHGDWVTFKASYRFLFEIKWYFVICCHNRFDRFYFLNTSTNSNFEFCSVHRTAHNDCIYLIIYGIWTRHFILIQHFSIAWFS